MLVLDKYLVKEFFRLLLVCLTVFVFLYLMIDFVGGIDNFMEANAPSGAMFAYYAYKVPAAVSHMLPPATLTAVIIMFSVLKKNRELIALKACGVSLWKVFRPIMVTSLFLSLGLFLLLEIAVPYASSRGNAIWRTEVRKQKPGFSAGRYDIFYRGSKCMYWIREFDSTKQMMIEPSIYFLDDAFRLTRRITARTALWDNGVWRMMDGIVQDLGNEQSHGVKSFHQLELRLPEGPDDFRRDDIEPEEMSYRQLKRFARKLRGEGYDATRYFVETNIKLAFPFILMIMAALGIPVALWREKMGAPLCVSIGIGLCFMYMLVLGYSRALGNAGILPPVLSAWLANGCFFFLCIYWMNHVNR
jgi:lipopolysaccharide export system permease protein